MESLLVVDDDSDLCEVLCEGLVRQGRSVDRAHDDVHALRKLEEREFDLVLVDLDLRSPRDGLDILKAIRSRNPRTQVILMTGFGSLDSAVRGMRAGAYDYISKPFDVRALLPLVERALAAGGRASAPVATPAQEPLPVGLVGRTAGIVEVFKQIALAVDARMPVLIVGETGTGKELVARAHPRPCREQRPLRGPQLRAPPETLLECELFGHVRGAFTGAAPTRRAASSRRTAARSSWTRSARCPSALQAKLLRVLQEGEFRPRGRLATVRSTCAWSPRPTATWSSEWRRSAFERTSITALAPS